jgi:hypothetical protein
MRYIALKVFSVCLVTVSILKANDLLQLAEGKMFEFSLYANMTTIEKNVYLQTDFGAGINFLNHFNSTLTINIQHRNYSTVTNDFISFSGGVDFNKNEIRIGLIGGFYTLSFSGYHNAVPCGGGEIIYAYNIFNGISLRFKERVVVYSEENNSTVGTSSFIGFCFAFRQ